LCTEKLQLKLRIKAFLPQSEEMEKAGCDSAKIAEMLLLDLLDLYCV
jgi:hypothetical protein